MRRREFIAALGSTAAWPLAARAQQRESTRRISIIMNQAADDAEGPVRVAAFEQALQKLGWTPGRNIQIDYRWAAGDIARAQQYAAELVALRPDVILAAGGFGVERLLQATRSIPIVFISVLDPVGAGYVESLARPGGNATGLINFEYAIGGKWLELLKEISPSVNRIAVLRDPSIPSGSGQLGAIQGAASSLGLEVRPIDARNVGDLDRVVTAFATLRSGLVVTASAPTLVHRQLIVTLAARNKLPAVYPYRYFAEAGGLISYGPATSGLFGGAATYVDRILKGEKPADLPVQAPTTYELAINLKTAKAIGLTVPPTLLARADEVIE
jgi:putative tryptophan/tyrosine transport system substrate-binding protein